MSFLQFLLLTLVLTTELFSYPNYSQAYKEKKLYPMGEKIYKKKCSHLNVKNYKSYEALHTAVLNKALCVSLNKKYAEALSLYLWDLKRVPQKQNRYKKLTVSKSDKCPVCGMLLYKYPRWIARIEYNEKKLSFDGIKDMMKYYFEHSENIKNILVQEYYTQKVIDAKRAYFVLGSDVYGPMGNELIAFRDKRSAKQFFIDHKAKKIVTFDEITPKIVYNLDE